MSDVETPENVERPVIEDMPALKYWMRNEYEVLTKSVNLLERNHSPLRQSYHERRLELIKIARAIGLELSQNETLRVTAR